MAIELDLCGWSAIELLFLMVMIGIGTGSAMALYRVGGFWLAVPGFVAGVLLIPFAAFTHSRYRKWVYLGDKDMPECSCGSDQYKYEKFGEEYHLLCQKCRKRYEKRRYEVFVYENGERRLFKRLVKHRGWI